MDGFRSWIAEGSVCVAFLRCSVNGVFGRTGDGGGPLDGVVGLESWRMCDMCEEVGSAQYHQIYRKIKASCQQ